VLRDWLGHPIGRDQIVGIGNLPAQTRLNGKLQGRLHALCAGERRPLDAATSGQKRPHHV
jgi:hypothetical protein